MFRTGKFAIRGFTESLRMESKLEFPHLTVHTVHPGGIKTNIVKNSRWIEGDLSEEEQEAFSKRFEKLFITTPDKAAQTIIKGIKKKRSKILIGNDARKLDWAVRLFPQGYTNLIVRDFKKNSLVD